MVYAFPKEVRKTINMANKDQIWRDQDALAWHSLIALSLDETLDPAKRDELRKHGLATPVSNKSTDMI